MHPVHVLWPTLLLTLLLAMFPAMFPAMLLSIGECDTGSGGPEALRVEALHPIATTWAL